MKKIAAIVCALLCAVTFVAAEGTQSFSMGVDFAVYPHAAPVAGSGSHFVGFDRFFSAYEGRVTGNWNYKMPALTGDGSNPLISGNNVTFGVSGEFTPVSIGLTTEVSCTPVAFLIFTAGGKVASGWRFIGIDGIATWNGTDYTTSKPFSNVYYQGWLKGQFQFDLAALMPGDWNHVVTLAAYQLEYKGFGGCNEAEAWKWQGSGERASGLGYYSNVIVGYQMPLVLQTVGVMAEFNGTYKANKLSSAYDNWDPTFCAISISPVAILQFNDANSLNVQIGFSSRRSFSTAPANGEYGSNFDLTTVGREWYFNRVGLSYSHSF